MSDKCLEKYHEIKNLLPKAIVFDFKKEKEYQLSELKHMIIIVNENLCKNLNNNNIKISLYPNELTEEYFEMLLHHFRIAGWKVNRVIDDENPMDSIETDIYTFTWE
jgi:hypothetical protein